MRLFVLERRMGEAARAIATNAFLTKQGKRFLARLLATAHELSVDSAGRILLPQMLKSMLL